jgi:hypothetical protein
MAMCDFCRNDMAEKPVGCVSFPLIVNGRHYEPIGWGSETGPQATYHLNLDGPCGDCNAPRGGLHHPGCDLAQCPVCGGQMLGCGCVDDNDLVRSHLLFLLSQQGQKGTSGAGDRPGLEHLFHQP